MRYLIVDDDALFRERLSRALEKAGHEIETGANADEGLRGARAFNPDRAIVDLRMPGASGLELVASLKSELPHIAIVVLTGFGSIATAQEAIIRGATGYLTKPCSFERILAAFDPPQLRPKEPLPVPTLDQVEWEHIQRVFEDCGGNVSKTAKALGMDRRSLQRRFAKPPRLK